MENKNTFGSDLENPFSFLDNPDVQQHFADLNISLLEGKHIEPSDLNHYKLLLEYWEELGYFYENLYQLKLTKAINGNYCYLDFFEAHYGKLTDISRRRELTELQTVCGLLLLKIYLDREFEKDKTVKSSDLRKELFESEDSASYKRVFFNAGDDREHFTNKEMKRFFDRIYKPLKRFEQIGWVDKLKREDDENLQFIIRESIMRLALLYENEIKNFDEFALNFEKFQRSR